MKFMCYGCDISMCVWCDHCVRIVCVLRDELVLIVSEMA